jgi:hypothetical protein
MKRWLVARLRMLRDDPQLWEWLAAGLVGGLTGGAATAWLFWGWPNLLRDGVCFIFWLAAGAAMFAFTCAMGVSAALLIRLLVKAIRRLRTPPAYAMWEPPEPVPEIDLGLFSHPGCAVGLYLPLILLSGVLSLVCIVLAFRQVPVGRVVVMVVLGLPFGLAMARSDIKRRPSIPPGR